MPGSHITGAGVLGTENKLNRPRNEHARMMLANRRTQKICGCQSQHAWLGRHWGRKERSCRSSIPAHCMAGSALGPKGKTRRVPSSGAHPTEAGLVWFVNQHRDPKQMRESFGESGAQSEKVISSLEVSLVFSQSFVSRFHFGCFVCSLESIPVSGFGTALGPVGRLTWSVGLR